METGEGGGHGRQGMDLSVRDYGEVERWVKADQRPLRIMLSSLQGWFLR
jgi:hypothetical protein